MVLEAVNHSFMIEDKIRLMAETQTWLGFRLACHDNMSFNKASIDFSIATLILESIFEYSDMVVLEIKGSCILHITKQASKQERTQPISNIYQPSPHQVYANKICKQKTKQKLINRTPFLSSSSYTTIYAMNTQQNKLINRNPFPCVIY